MNSAHDLSGLPAAVYSTPQTSARTVCQRVISQQKGKDGKMGRQAWKHKENKKYHTNAGTKMQVQTTSRHVIKIRRNKNQILY